jgi:hypothetical protein
MFQIKVVEKIKTHILYSTTFYRISCRLWGKVEKYGGAIENAHYVAYWINKPTRSQRHARVHANTHTHTHARTHTLTNARTHAEKYVILIAFPRQQWLRERVSVIRYTYIAGLVSLINVHFILTVFCMFIAPYSINWLVFLVEGKFCELRTEPACVM